MKMSIHSLRNILAGTVPALLLLYIGYQWYRDKDTALQHQVQTRLAAALPALRTENRSIQIIIDKSTWEYRNFSHEAVGQASRRIWRESEELIDLLDTLSVECTTTRVQAADHALQQWYRTASMVNHPPVLRPESKDEISQLFRPQNWLSEALRQHDRFHFQSICKQTQAEVGVICYQTLLQIDDKLNGMYCGWRTYAPILLYTPLHPAPGDTLEARVVLPTSDNAFKGEVLMVNGNPLTITEGVGALKLRYKTPGLYPLHVKHFYQTWENDSLYRSEQTYHLRVH